MLRCNTATRAGLGPCRSNHLSRIIKGVHSHRYGLCYLSFRGRLLWSALDDQLKRAVTLRGFAKWVGKEVILQNLRSATNCLLKLEDLRASKVSKQNQKRIYLIIILTCELHFLAFLSVI